MLVAPKGTWILQGNVKSEVECACAVGHGITGRAPSSVHPLLLAEAVSERQLCPLQAKNSSELHGARLKCTAHSELPAVVCNPEEEQVKD